MTPVGPVRYRPPSCAGSLATAVYGRFDIGRRNFRWASAGHLLPLVVAADGQQLLRRRGGIMAGAAAQAAYADDVEQLTDGDLLVLYTDGLIEGRSSDLDADSAALLAAATGLTGTPAQYVCDTLISRLLPASGVQDDVCVLVLERSS